MQSSIKLDDIVGIVYVCETCGAIICSRKAQGQDRFPCPKCKTNKKGIRSFQMKDGRFIEITEKLWPTEAVVISLLILKEKEAA